MTGIPSLRQCQALIQRESMPAHIVRHSVLVCRVALTLGRCLDAGGVRMDMPLIQAGALLHDITKPRSFHTGENHVETGRELVAAEGFPEVAEIVWQHVQLREYFACQTPDEAEIVNYADKRVLHDQIVSLDDRMAYILTRYGSSPERQARLDWIWQRTRESEARIFHYVHFKPAAIPAHLIPLDWPEDLT